MDPSAVSAAWRDVIYKGSDAVYLESSSTGTGNAPAGGGTFGGQDEFAGGSSALAANTWSYLAETYDGSTIRLYVNGTQVGSLAASGAVLSSTSPLQIGGDSLFGQYFSGLIDEVRVYNVALSAAQIQSDMTTPVGSSDTQPPTAPGALTATAGAAGQITLNWTASTDNAGVTGYLVERCQGAGCTNFAQIATPTATGLTDTGLAAGASYSYRVRATDAAGNLSPYSNTATATVAGSVDTQPPTVPGSLTATAGAAGKIELELDGLDRQRRGDRVPRRALPGCRLLELRSGRRHRRRPGSRTRVWLRARATATASARPTQPGTSAPTRTPQPRSLRRLRRGWLLRMRLMRGRGRVSLIRRGTGIRGRLRGRRGCRVGSSGRRCRSTARVRWSRFPMRRRCISVRR